MPAPSNSRPSVPYIGFACDLWVIAPLDGDGTAAGGQRLRLHRHDGLARIGIAADDGNCALGDVDLDRECGGGRLTGLHPELESLHLVCEHSVHDRRDLVEPALDEAADVVCEFELRALARTREFPGQNARDGRGLERTDT